MKLCSLVLATLLPAFASAAQLTYQIDLAQSKMDEIMAFDICGLPQEIKMDAKEDLPTVVIKRTHALNPSQLSINYIQRTSGSISGGGLVEPYVGAYRTRVALVHSLEYSEAYKGGVYYRAQVTTYGSVTAPKSFIVTSDLLNYLESAELAEGSLCTNYAYRLK